MPIDFSDIAESTVLSPRLGLLATLPHVTHSLRCGLGSVAAVAAEEWGVGRGVGPPIARQRARRVGFQHLGNADSRGNGLKIRAGCASRAAVAICNASAAAFGGIKSEHLMTSRKVWGKNHSWSNSKSSSESVSSLRASTRGSSFICNSETVARPHGVRPKT